MYEYTRRHFIDLWERYEGPIVVFDLIRQIENKRKRETKLGDGLKEAITELVAQLEREQHPLASGLRCMPPLHVHVCVCACVSVCVCVCVCVCVSSRGSPRMDKNQDGDARRRVVVFGRGYLMR